jgi:hypothetical protein
VELFKSVERAHCLQGELKKSRFVRVTALRRQNEQTNCFFFDAGASTFRVVGKMNGWFRALFAFFAVSRCRFNCDN